MTDITVVIPTFNSELYIEETLNSILRSANSDPAIKTEIIVVDAESTDTTLSIVRSFMERNKDLSVKYFSRRDSGAAEALNFGFGEASGRLLTYCDSDDLFTSKPYQPL